jgi:hypothetical protein
MPRQLSQESVKHSGIYEKYGMPERRLSDTQKKATKKTNP